MLRFIFLTATSLVGAAVAVKQHLIEQTSEIQKFAVNGSAIPEVNFDIGESYAGLLPISPEEGAPKYFFWFVPTETEEAKDEITIWLNGGPGCSSMEGFLEENGPISWRPGTVSPVKNPFAWSNMTNMIWIDQPGGTGFSTRGNKTYQVTNETALAQHFLGFFEKFTDTFNLHDKKIYITGESYAGKYIPYFADAMLNANDTKHFDVKGTMIIDGVLNTDQTGITDSLPSYPFAKYWSHLFDLEPEQLEALRKKYEECGYDSYLNKYLTFPPPAGSFAQPNTSNHCFTLWSDVYRDIVSKNPCVSYYNVLTQCPSPFDPLGATFGFTKKDYFARKDVQAQLNVPFPQNWIECTERFDLVHDRSPPTAWTILPGVIERSERTLIVQGNADMLIIAQGNLLTLQNMTWGGAQGFQTEPADKLYVPKIGKGGAHGNMGITHTERGLTWAEVHLAGHMVPSSQPSTAYRLLQYLLGRIDGLTQDQN